MGYSEKNRNSEFWDILMRIFLMVVCIVAVIVGLLIAELYKYR